ncbi:MAG: hypothetical protein KDI98_05105 [Hyphomicrobiaceae bacterium]|nr:hypothetical protein [Hyphomicrobiaceae bacterium]
MKTSTAKAVNAEPGKTGERTAAIELVSALFDAAEEEGVSEIGVAEAALFQSVMRLVGVYGEDAVARSLEKTVLGVRGGYYTLAGPAH